MLIREAVRGDAEMMARLIAELGYAASAEDIARRASMLSAASYPPLVADNGSLAGCVTWHVMEVLHRPTPVGRISMLIVAPACRGAGVGRLLVQAVEARVAERGCALLEVTSNLKLADAHAFYERLGYDRTSYRFAKPLPHAAAHAGG